jgi:cell division protein FtsB
MRNVRRKQVDHRRKRRRLIFVTFGILSIIYLSFSLIFGESGLLRYLELKSTRDKLLAESNAIEKQNEEIKGLIETLENEPDLVEELAREYGLTKEGELIFKFEDEK